MNPVRHLRHHHRFYAALAAGALVLLLAPLPRSARVVAAGDALFAIYLVWTALALREATPDRIRQKARQEDEGLR
jgi:uncharacterized membrane protein